MTNAGSRYARFILDDTAIILKGNPKNYGYSFSGDHYLIKKLSSSLERPKLLCSTNNTEDSIFVCEDFFVDNTRDLILFVSSDPNLPGANTKNQVYMRSLVDLDLPITLISTTDGTTPFDANVFLNDYDEGSGNILLRSNTSNTSLSNTKGQQYLKNIESPSSPPVGISTTDGSTPINLGVYDGIIVGDGSKVVISSKSDDLASQNGMLQLYLKDLSNLAAAPIILSTADGSTPADQPVFNILKLPGRNSIAFSTDATNLGIASGGNYQVYMKNLNSLNSPPTVLSTTGSNEIGNFGSFLFFNQDQANASKSKNNWFLFKSSATNFSEPNPADYIFMRDLDDLAKDPTIINKTDSGRHYHFDPGIAISESGNYIVYYGAGNSGNAAYLKYIGP